MENRSPCIPLVSVCIPTYNRADKLQKAVESLLVSTCQDIEIIISDNASSDNTQAASLALCKRSAKIKYFRQETNFGPTRNFDFVRKAASGKYFLWLSDDDYLDPDYISACANWLESNPEFVLVSGSAVYHSRGNLPTINGVVVESQSNIRFMRVLHYLWFVYDNAMFYGLYRRQAVESCELQNSLAGDWTWVAEVLLEGKAKTLSEQHIHRERGEGTSSSVQRIVNVLGVGQWQARYPWLAIPLELATHLSMGSKYYREKFLPLRWLVFLVVFAVAFSRQCAIFLSNRVARHATKER